MRDNTSANATISQKYFDEVCLESRNDFDLTEAEAVRYLRVDTLDRKDPSKTLQYYRERGLIVATRISNVNFYLRAELDRFLATMS